MRLIFTVCGGVSTTFLCLPTCLVVLAEVAVAADTLCVHEAVGVFTLGGHLCSSFGMIAILAHSISIIGKSGMCAFGDTVTMDLVLNAFAPV